MRPMIDDGGGWDIRNPRRDALGLGRGSNIPVTLDGTGSGELYKPPVVAGAPTLPVHPGMTEAPPIGVGIGSELGGAGLYASSGMGGGGMSGGPITPRMVRPRGDRGNTGW